MSKHTRELIIESPGLQRPLPRGMWAIATAFFWFGWFWLWLPLLSIIGWAFGVYTVFDQFVVHWGYIELLRLLPYYLLVIGTSGLLLVGWSLLQYYRFHGKERRRGFPVVTRADIAKGLGLAPETTEPWVRARRMVAHHDENGRVSWVEMSEVSANASEAGQLGAPKPAVEEVAVLAAADQAPEDASASENGARGALVYRNGDVFAPLVASAEPEITVQPATTATVAATVHNGQEKAVQTAVQKRSPRRKKADGDTEPKAKLRLVTTNGVKSGDQVLDLLGDNAVFDDKSDDVKKTTKPRKKRIVIEIDENQLIPAELEVLIANAKRQPAAARRPRRTTRAIKSPGPSDDGGSKL